MAVGIKHGKLYGVSLSPFVRKVRAALAIKSIDYELVNVMPGAMDPDFLKKSPLSKIPVWEEEGWTLPDSSAICAYLEKQVPSPALYPTDPRAFAVDLFWEEYADTRIVQSSSPIFFQRVVRARVFNEPADEEIVRRHIEEVLPPVLDQLEALFMGREGADLAELTIAKLSVWSPLVNLDHAGFELDVSQWPKLSAFMNTLSSHPVLNALVVEERAALAAY